jgi:Ca2+-binding EF-hand superfamily protein
MQIYEVTLMEIFDIFDVDDSQTVEAHELANCLAVMCGGSMGDKINAAFLLFDQNGSGTMSYDELVALIRTVFSLVKHTLDINEKRGKQYSDDDSFAGDELDFDQLAMATAKKAFLDLMVPQSSEINYQQFVQWITGQNLYSDDELEALQRTQPPSKSKFAAKKFTDTSEFCKRFLQEEEFLDVV